MASSDELKKLAGKLMSDASYRQRFSANPESAARELGITLNGEQLRRAKEFKGSDTALENMAAQANKGMNAAWGAE